MVAKPIKGGFRIRNVCFHCSGIMVSLHRNIHEVYGQKDKEDPFIETNYGYIDFDNIRNSYSESKRASEMLCKSYAKEYDIDVSIV